MKLDINTFGKTPAAQYLARYLMSLNDPNYTKSCSVRTQTYNKMTHELEVSVKNGTMSAKSASNLLRLLRLEVTQIQLSRNKDHALLDQLLKNVIIGNIKQIGRKLTVLTKIHNGVDQVAHMAKKTLLHNNTTGQCVYTICGYPVIKTSAKDDESIIECIPVTISDISDGITADLLHTRSEKRCRRLNKPHMS